MKVNAVPAVAVAEAALVKVGTVTVPALLTVRVNAWVVVPPAFFAVNVVG